VRHSLKQVGGHSKREILIEQEDLVQLISFIFMENCSTHDRRNFIFSEADQLKWLLKGSQLYWNIRFS